VGRDITFRPRKGGNVAIWTYSVGRNVGLTITNNTQTNPEYFLSSYVMKDKEIERHGFVGPAIRFRKEQFFEAK